MSEDQKQTDPQPNGCDPASGSPKPPKLRRDWIGKRVRLRREISNRVTTLPKGMICIVRSMYRGAELKSAACDCCGVAVHISQVPWSALEYLGENDPAISRHE